MSKSVGLDAADVVTRGPRSARQRDRGASPAPPRRWLVRVDRKNYLPEGEGCRRHRRRAARVDDFLVGAEKSKSGGGSPSVDPFAAHVLRPSSADCRTLDMDVRSEQIAIVARHDDRYQAKSPQRRSGDANARRGGLREHALAGQACLDERIESERASRFRFMDLAQDVENAPPCPAPEEIDPAPGFWREPHRVDAEVQARRSDGNGVPFDRAACESNVHARFARTVACQRSRLAFHCRSLRSAPPSMPEGAYPFSESRFREGARSSLDGSQ